MKGLLQHYQCPELIFWKAQLKAVRLARVQYTATLEPIVPGWMLDHWAFASCYSCIFLPLGLHLCFSFPCYSSIVFLGTPLSYFKGSTYKWDHAVLLFLCLAYAVFQVHPQCHKRQGPIPFQRLSNISIRVDDTCLYRHIYPFFYAYSSVNTCFDYSLNFWEKRYSKHRSTGIWTRSQLPCLYLIAIEK